MGALKLQTTFFYKRPMDASGWMKKDEVEKLVIVAKWYLCQIIEHDSCNGHM